MPTPLFFVAFFSLFYDFYPKVSVIACRMRIDTNT
jgi:hypothetical protein